MKHWSKMKLHPVKILIIKKFLILNIKKFKIYSLEAVEDLLSKFKKNKIFRYY